MDTFRGIRGWSKHAGAWPALVGSLILAGTTWLLTGLLTGPSAAGPSAAGPSAAGPSAAGPSAAGPSAAGDSGAAANQSRTTADRPTAAPMRAASEEAASGPARHPLDDALEFVEPSRQALKNVEDYTAVFTRTELIHGRLLTEQMDMKFRQNPFSVYLHGNAKRKEGRELIFSAGRNDGKLVAHEVGLKSIVGTMYLNPDDLK